MSIQPGTPAGHPSEEHTSIGNDSLTGGVPANAAGAPRGTPASEVAQSPTGGAAEREVAAAPLPQGVFWQAARGPGPGVAAAGVFSGTTVTNAAGEALGRVEEMMVDLASGRIAYLVLEPAVPGNGELCAVPWTAFEVEPAKPALSLAFSPGDFRQAPCFSRQQWPSMSEAAWVEEVHRFFAAKPYWL